MSKNTTKKNIIASYIHTYYVMFMLKMLCDLFVVYWNISKKKENFIHSILQNHFCIERIEFKIF